MGINSFKTEITKFHYKRANNISAFVKSLLRFSSYFYDFVTVVRNFMYDKGILKSEKIPATVISVGNLTTGGVGKTPVVAEIANYYAECANEKVCIISRGYGGHLNNKKVNEIKANGEILCNAYYAGDEPYWLAENTKPSVIVLTCANRVLAARYAVQKFGVTKIILDDAFQHRKIHRDIDIVLIDSEMKFGNEAVLPFGPLRENLLGLKRASLIFVVSKNVKHNKAEQFARILSKKIDKNVLICKVEPDIIYNIKTNEVLDKNKSVTALCAIGQPEQFLKFLSDYDVENIVIYEDHYFYTYNDIAQLSGNIITTEKDAVKIQRFGFDNVYALKLKTNIDLHEVLKK